MKTTNRSRSRRRAWLPLAALLTACGAPTNPSATERPGVIEFYSDPVQIEVPESVAAGEPFEVSVRTYGGGCILQDRTDVEGSGMVADVRPYDRHVSAPICTTELRLFNHTATVTFPERGTGRIRVHGMRAPADVPLVVERRVEVR